MKFSKLPEGSLPIATERAKWSQEYQERVGIDTGPAQLSDELLRGIQRLARRTYRALELSGYARLDLRLGEDGRVYVIEANPNPELALEEDFAESARAAGMDYDAVIQRIVNLGMSYRPPWSPGGSWWPQPRAMPARSRCFFSSSLATVRRCTSSGPSASRSVRIEA
jgi:D-alanine-D-alanine ligase